MEGFHEKKEMKRVMVSHEITLIHRFSTTGNGKTDDLQ